MLGHRLDEKQKGRQIFRVLQVPITCLPFGLGTKSHTWFLSNWLSSSCMARIYSSSSKAYVTLEGSIWETKAMLRQASLRFNRVDTPWFMSPIILSIGLSLYVLHSWGRST